MHLSVALLAQLATGCAPRVALETLAAVAVTESALDTDALRDNTTGIRHRPPSHQAAVTLATQLIGAGHSVDLGLMQINSRNLGWLGLSVDRAFDACASIEAGGRVLAAAYAPPESGAGVQPALARALSRYNTGDPQRGIANGYVARVQASADRIVPALRPSGEAGGPTPPAAPEPPSWDVYATARAHHGARGTAPQAASVPAEAQASKQGAAAPVLLKELNQGEPSDAP